MPKKKYVVDLSAEERATLEHLLRGGKTGARKLTRARILLKAADGLSDNAIAATLDVGTATVARTRQRFVETNLGALDRCRVYACPRGAGALDPAALGRQSRGVRLCAVDRP